MLTADKHAALVTMAGEGMTWENAPGSSRPASDVRPALFAYLAEYAGYVCVFCGMADDERTGEACHIVSSGGSVNGNRIRKGYVESNLGYGCRVCNEIDGETHSIVPFNSIVRPDLIPDKWPSFPTLRVMTKSLREEKESSRVLKCQVRGL